MKPKRIDHAWKGRIGKEGPPTRLWATWVSQTRPQSSLIEPLPTSIGARSLMGMMCLAKSTGDELDRDNFEGAKQPTKLILLLQLCVFYLYAVNLLSILKILL